jgi:glucokinase-like ROK family protein
MRHSLSLKAGDLGTEDTGPIDVLQSPQLVDSVLRLIWREHQISRAGIARGFGLSRSTVTETVKSLLKTGFVAEVGTGTSNGGRRPILLEFQDEARYILGVDLGASHIAVVLTNLRGQIREWKEVSHPVRTDPEGTRALIAQLCDACLSTVEGGADKLLSISVAVPSPIDPAHPEWLPEVVIPAWHGHSELDRLHQRYGVPVYVDNDANLGALAEHWWGAGRGANNMIYIKLGRGVGAGCIFDGQIYRGVSGGAGEIGHVPIDLNGALCVCGLRGCLVTLIGASALKARVSTLLADHPDSVLAGETPTMDAIAKAALAGDVLALQVVREAAAYLGIALAGVINLINPQMVVLGGNLSQVGELLLEPVRDKVRQATLTRATTSVELRVSELGRQAIAIGAATLALEAAFAAPDFLERSSRPGIL